MNNVCIKLNLFFPLPVEATAAVTSNVHPGFVLVGTFGGILYCLNTETGKMQWKFEDCKDIIKTKPTINGDHVIFGCHDGFIRCLNITDGRLIWSKNIGAPSVANIIITSDGELSIS